MRDNKWLENLFDEMWEKYFFDVRRANQIEVKFSRKARTRLGSIRMTRDKKKSIILLNGLFRDSLIPTQVVEGVLAHEIVHYAHGFCSPLKRQHRHPHKGGVVKNEMVSRGLEHQYRIEKAWTKDNFVKEVSL
ncbi:hypothetical protein COW94_02150 [Candidatus Peregrinibacteria bacterium CG22_combo_CG10-13_8_21_14_all_44_10]|nr:MAG: hypothetical protein AUK45_00185 [Candidatus Peregrinibacteria bacterium CG2_30_44_17]PIP66352.1 MAG: hypothetical protein COW94_02150 [Candidatus Peregrinibacteria bacterium CG22_combo_CG10-13_8_21_14_all_44_10]PIX80044.1 MAG: hypothetical protein COZ35_01970 [Candidatus Peregrinibacteria bacterium CG_4_10_14_3_um_filter_44_21]PJB89624.1 MAG: hypothetical protein CO082_00285 [Candidatus Peregrinibacteria bacterium CG_4_9_14_0_8_um_filter_44_15]